MRKNKRDNKFRMKRQNKLWLGIVLICSLFIQMGGRVGATEGAVEKTPEQVAQEELDAAYAMPVESNTVKNWPVGPAIYGEAGIVMDMKSGAILYEKNMDSKYYPASITKVLTALVALENTTMSTPVTFTESSVDFIEPGDACLGVHPGEQISMENALYGMMLASANDVAHGIGEYGDKNGYDAFIDDMNKRVEELGGTNSHFVNTNGLHDDNHYTTAHDMALIATEAFKHEEFRKIVSTLQYTIPATNLVDKERVFQQNHKMLYPQNQYYYQSCVGGKTGFTDQALTTLVTYADNGAMQLVAVNLKTRGGRVVYTDTANMFEYAFNNFSKMPISDNETSTDIKTILEKEAYVVVPNNVKFSDLKSEIEYEKKASSREGTITYTYEGRFVGSAKVEVSESYVKKIAVTKAKVTDAKEEKNAPEGVPLWTKIILGIVGIVIVIFGFFLYKVVKINRRKRNRNRNRNRQG